MFEIRLTPQRKVESGKWKVRNEQNKGAAAFRRVGFDELNPAEPVETMRAEVQFP